MATGWVRTLAILALAFAGSPCQAATAAREIVTPQGLRVWLVEDHSAPLLTLGFRFAGGSAQDPPGKLGLAHLTAETFLQGAGAFSSDAYLKAWNGLGAEPNFEARNESLRGTLKVLTEDRDKAADLLALAVLEPHLTPDALEDVRDQVLADLEHQATDPESVGYAAYGRLAYGDHPMAKPLHGAAQDVSHIAASDILDFRRRVLARDGLTLSAVGDVTPAETGVLLDRVFGALPLHGELRPMPDPAPPRAQRLDIPLTASEAEVVFGVGLGPLTPRQRDIAELLNYTLGGSAFTSRLYSQIRDRRGLAYSIGTSLDNYSVVSEITGTFGAEPVKAEQAIALARDELAKLASDGPTDSEVDEAKAALAGQYLRGLIKRVDLANELTLRMAQGFPPDCIATYGAKLAAIAPDEVRAFGRAVPWLDRLIVVTVGARPEPSGARDQATGERSRAQAAPGNEP